MHEQDLQNLEHFIERYREEIVNYKSEAEAHTAVPSTQPYIDELALPDVHHKEGIAALPSPVTHSAPTRKKELVARVSEVTTTQPYSLSGAEWLQTQVSRAERRGDFRGFHPVNLWLPMPCLHITESLGKRTVLLLHHRAHPQRTKGRSAITGTEMRRITLSSSHFLQSRTL